MGHRDGPPLYGRMMKSISSGHDRANRMRMLKLPLIFTEQKLYAGAIAQFYWLSDALEAQLRRHADHPMVAKVAELGLCVTPGYASDLKELYGEGWREVALAARTPATASYVAVLEAADPVSLVAAAFILYGALVVGGGKATQAKVRRVLPGCEHRLFDVAEDMAAARHARNAVSVVPQLSALASSGGLARLLAALALQRSAHGSMVLIRPSPRQSRRCLCLRPSRRRGGSSRRASPASASSGRSTSRHSSARPGSRTWQRPHIARLLGSFYRASAEPLHGSPAPSGLLPGLSSPHTFNMPPRPSFAT